MAPRTERIFIVAALLTLGLALILALNRGMIASTVAQPAWLTPLTALMLVLVAAIGALWSSGPAQFGEGVMAVSPRLPIVPIPLDIIIPILLTVGFAAFLQLFESGPLQAVLVLFAGASFAGVLWAQAHASNTSDRYFALAQSALNIISHLTAFLLFSVIFAVKARSVYSATAVGIVAVLLLFELLSRDAAWHRAMNLPMEGRRSAVGLLSLGGGLVAAELMWGLNYWAAVSTLVGGAFMLVVFYVIHGLASHYLDHKLNRRILLEFGVVAMTGVAVVFISAFFQ